MAEDGLSVFSASSHDMSWDKPPFFALPCLFICCTGARARPDTWKPRSLGSDFKSRQEAVGGCLVLEAMGLLLMRGVPAWVDENIRVG
jgi:hypothetical protein